ncbi:glycoside hydrolase family 79 protein [Lophiostoma macrostomum CBS 122681]|uniref:Glycoside hydrolase family 79 protein n=1 Tax=Lophiostoma macrostomum CBS 122681 TaxID=1314788 RepID=A0A6A6T576_9PLEO|nr:glycoside hydrolase family 79 protein [Lophiostoma macrostomum CBS 122681]
MSLTERANTTFTLPASLGNWNTAKVRRLTAPGVDVSTGITLAGQSIDESGKIVGQESVESVIDNEVLVGAGEAVLVTL